MKLPPQYFRAGVGAVIFNNDGRVLVFERSDIPGAWQLPQGGLKEDEEPSTAVFREIEEETGISQDDLRFVDQYPEPLAYELPPAARRKKTGRGQAQYWFLFEFTGNDNKIDISRNDEFQTWNWRTIKELLSETVDFRIQIYRHLSKRFSQFLLQE